MTHPQPATEPLARCTSVSAYLMRPTDLDVGGWNNLALFLQRPIALQSEFTHMQLMEDVAQGRCQLWALVDDETQDPVGALISSIVEYESGLRAVVVRSAGTLGTDLDWESMRSVILTMEYFAADNGCDVVRVPGRRGWGRVFSDYEVAYVMHEKRIVKEES